MRIVLDTNILVRANTKGRGPARELLQIIVNAPNHVLLLSPALLTELERVFSYSRIRLATDLTDQEVLEYMNSLRSSAASEMVFPTDAPRVVHPDPDDDAIVHTAVFGHADWLCTLNRHFYQPSVLEYCNRHGIQVGTDVDLLRILRTPKDVN